MKKTQKVYAEIGYGNNTFLNTEIELWKDNKEISEERISHFILPEKIQEIYFRLWIFKKVLIISTKNGINFKKKSKNKLKILFGIGGIGLKKIEIWQKN